MKVFAVNGSPKMDKGTTAAVLNPFLDGMEAAGARVSRHDTSKMSILVKAVEPFVPRTPED